jgi:hypothetical protein
MIKTHKKALAQIWENRAAASKVFSSSADISNNPGFHLKHPVVPDGSDGSDGTPYPLTQNYMLPVAQATGLVA